MQVAGIADFFTNKEATSKKEVDVESPAFSLTKVQGGLATLIAAIGVAGAKLEGPTAVKVAAIGGGALVMIGFFGLAAVDLITRQRASEAKLRWGAPAGKGAPGSDSTSPDVPPTNSGGNVVLVADSDDLVLQEKHSGDEYEVRFAELEGDKVTLIARRNGKTLTSSFQRPS
jgi:hypothetical protein